MEKFAHLTALQESLSREQERLANAKNQNERNFYKIVTKLKDIKKQLERNKP